MTPCTHSLVVDECRGGDGEELDYAWFVEHVTVMDAPIYFLRRCLLCGDAYDRMSHMARLRDEIRARHRLPPSPWSGAERSDEAIW